MKCCRIHLLMLACLLFAGCAERARSISHSDYAPQGSYGRTSPSDRVSDPDFQYRGELSEFDVLGIGRDEIASEADIQRTLDNSKPVKLHRGSSILLIQSGALFPDGPMVAELSKHFTVVPFSGVPVLRRSGRRAFETESPDPESYSKNLRLTAARGGNDMILCYWGMLESESEHLPTKTVSWVPIVNWAVPDEKQHMRIQLKLALLDVRSGNWSVLSPKPFEDVRISTSPRRGAVDQRQVERLKQLAYEAGVAELIHTHSDLAL